MERSWREQAERLRWTTNKCGGKMHEKIFQGENICCTLSNAPEKSKRMRTENWSFFNDLFRFRAYLLKVKFPLIDYSSSKILLNRQTKEFCLTIQFKKEIVFIYWVAITVLNPSEQRVNVLFSGSSESLCILNRISN